MAYAVTLYFTRRFVSGHLKGIVQHSSLGFTDVKSAVEWCNAVSTPKKIKRNKWELIDKSFQNYVR